MMALIRSQRGYISYRRFSAAFVSAISRVILIIGSPPGSAMPAEYTPSSRLYKRRQFTTLAILTAALHVDCSSPSDYRCYHHAMNCRMSLLRFVFELFASHFMLEAAHLLKRSLRNFKRLNTI